MNQKFKGHLENNIHILRAEKKISQKDLALKVGVSRQTIISLENNRYNPSLILAFEIAQVFQKDISEVFTYKKEEEEN
ncbi:helix-turn-helix transcriptional regulator [Alkalihalophilus lindianensis]|uniref:Helix-turn-helix transcriptional regulator n=1 Tax=Alkalihalophilus lindianensis TaxID=1630542 RepID=A0ABU3XEZ0_9BACI|nr:helix-turn-helix transcriptional regulator [Alkalihalophilus lindianensis]MDV2686467.1 helix-turn-helix transcriptional regulator [Alkalihalophilus lindianensis]